MSLKTNLISYWKLDEASGNAIDAHAANTLTASNSPGSDTGKVGNARTFNGTNQSFGIASNANLAVGNIDFTFSAWVFLSLKSVTRVAVAEWNFAATKRQFLLGFEPIVDVYRFLVSPDGTTASSVQVNASSLGSPPLNTWTHLVAWHDSVANTINIQANNGTVSSVSYASGVFASDSPLNIGSLLGTNDFWNGRIDEVGFWKRVLTADERTKLWNGGNGLSYDAFGGGIIPILRQHYAAQGAR
jgi:hypothetical protein